MRKKKMNKWFFLDSAQNKTWLRDMHGRKIMISFFIKPRDETVFDNSTYRSDHNRRVF